MRLDGNDEIIDVSLTDFGLADKISAWEKNDEFLKTMFEYQTNKKNTTHHFFEDFDVTLDDLISDPRLLDFSLLYYLDENPQK